MTTEIATETTGTSAPESAGGQVARRQRTLIGIVVSDKMDKTVVVNVRTRVKHPVLGKFVNRSAKYKAHDETNRIKEGDTVEIAEGRPISRTKSWTVVRLVEAARTV